PLSFVVGPVGTTRSIGRIDDIRDPQRVVRRDRREALDALLAGRPVERTRTLPVGCAIFRDSPAPAAAGGSHLPVTYARDVARILNDNCVVCHRRGEVAPFALESYEQARVWASQIKDYTARRLMPPWK